MRRNFRICLVLLGLCALTVGGCATAPTPTQIAVADCGEYPQNYEKIVKDFLNDWLVDPYSLRDFEILSPPARTWRPDWWDRPVFGYEVRMKYNSKNRMGGYIGKMEHIVFIRDGEVFFHDYEQLKPIPSHLPPAF